MVWGKWYRGEFGEYMRDAWPQWCAVVRPPPDEPFLPCSANVWTWRLTNAGALIKHGEAADRQCAARDAMASARAIAAGADPG